MTDKKINTVFTLDLDYDFDKFTASRHYDRLLNDLRGFEEHEGLIHASIRRSPSNHIHIRLEFDRQHTLLKQMAMRGFLGDDPHRLACELTRWYIYEDPDKIGRTFDEKCIAGIIRKAGEWQVIF